MISDNKEISEKVKEQRLLVRKLLAELNGKTMDYESCRMLEDFFNDYTDIWIDQFDIALVKIKEELDKKEIK